MGEHINKSADAQYTGVTEKTSLVSDDTFLIEDSAASGAKKRVKAGNFINFVDAYGEMYISTPVETSVSVTTPVKMAGTTTAGELSNFTHGTNRLTYNGTPTQKFEINSSISVNHAVVAQNKDFKFYYYKNGTTKIAESETKRTLSGTNDFGAVPLTAIVELSTNDYIEVWLEGVTDGTDVTAVNMSTIIHAAESAGIGLSGGGAGSQGITFLLRGESYVGIKQAQVLMPADATISKVKVYSDVQPTVTSLIVDININGVTIFTTQANRPTIAAGTNADDSGTPDITAVSEGDRISVDIDQIGTVAGGNDLMVSVVFA